MNDLFPLTGPRLSRRTFVTAGAAFAGAFVLRPDIGAAHAFNQAGDASMGTVTTKDGSEIFFKDWGSGQPIVFSHGWPLNADAWDSQMLFFGRQGYRVVAHDRRGHGRSSQSWNGNDMDTHADDLAAVIEALDLRDMIMVGHSTGGGEIAHYAGRHGTERIAKMVLVAAVPPLMLQGPDNPDGVPIEVLNGIRDGVAHNRAQFFMDFAPVFFGFNREGVADSEGMRLTFWEQGMQASVKGLYDCVHEFSEVDYTDDLKAMNVPTLIIQGDDDQVVPLAASGKKQAELLTQPTLKVYEGASHALAQTMADRFNEDLLSFIRS